jgi:hypothetical protein
MTRLLTRAALAGSGAVLSLIGGALLLAPISFLAMSDVVIEHDPGLISELAAPATLLLIAGALMLAGAVRTRIADFALGAGAVVYGGYGLGRMLAMALHGLPSGSLIAATVFELAVASALAALWFSNRNAEGSV